MESLLENSFSDKGKAINTNKAKKIDILGLSKYIGRLAPTSLMFSLENNLIASLKGCKTPPILTLFGPFRN